MNERWGYYCTHLRTNATAIIGKMIPGLYPGILGRDPQANKILTRGLMWPAQVEIERREPKEQAELLYSANVSGFVANTGQPLNPHAILFLAAQNNRPVIFNESANPPSNQTWGDLARNMAAARGLIGR